MHESVGVPSICTVHAPQCPSLHAIFVPVSPSYLAQQLREAHPDRRLDRRSAWPLTVSASSGMRRHRDDVGEMDETRRRPRDDARLRLVLGLRQRAPELARGEQELADLLELRRTWPLRSFIALSARPSAPNVSCWRAKSIGIAIERYWWMRASVIGCASTSAPCGCDGSSGGSPSAIRFALPASSSDDLLAR